MKIASAKDLTVYKKSYALGMRIFEVTKRFPPEERYALTGQLRRSSRSPCRSLREAWAKRRYEKHFVSKLTDADGEKAPGAQTRLHGEIRRTGKDGIGHVWVWAGEALRRILVGTNWRPNSGLNQEARERQLRDGDRSGGTQSAYIRVVNRRFKPLLPSPTRFCPKGEYRR